MLSECTEEDANGFAESAVAAGSASRAPGARTWPDGPTVTRLKGRAVKLIYVYAPSRDMQRRLTQAPHCSRWEESRWFMVAHSKKRTLIRGPLQPCDV
jgi:hypothetical protein